MKISVNGEEMVFDTCLTGGKLLDRLSIPKAAVVAELNGEVVPRTEFGEKILADGDVLELVTVVGGG